jgi:cell wall-associated NlpC family hydrolase
MHRRCASWLSRLAAALLAATLAGCFQTAHLPDQPAAPETAVGIPDPVRSRIVFAALQMVGVPYRYGGAAPDGFDCSGLVQYAYQNAGLSVPRTSREQLRASRPVGLDEVTAGDLLFFQSKDNSHVGIYVGDGRFVHAPATHRNVSIGRLQDGYYRKHFVRAGRLF